MTKTKSTKRALLISVLALLVSFSMLVGSTFAWFTDSVTSGRNKIVSGNLDVVLEYKNDWNDAWQEVGETTKIFTEGALYEPGYTEVVFLRVSNAGSLSLKYTLMVDIASEKGSTNIAGEAFKLSDYLQIGTYVQDEYNSGANYADILMPLMFGNREAALSNVGTLTKLSEAKGIVRSDAPILSGDQTAQVVAIVLTMPETVGNEANHRTDVAAPEIELGVNLIAAQFTDEADSFGSDYDKDAEYPVFPKPIEIDSSISFSDFAELIEKGGNIYLKESVTISNPESSRFTEFELKDNVGIYAAEGAELIFAETTTLIGNGTLTVYEGSIIEKQELCVSDNATLVFEDGEHSLAAFSATNNGTIVVNGGTLNCLGTYAGIMGICFGENGKLIVNDGTLNMYQPFNLNPNRCDAARIEINGGTIDLLNGIENLFVVRNVMDKDREAEGVLRGSSIRVNGGTFIAHYEIDSAGDATAFIRNGDAPSDTNKVLVSNAIDNYDCLVTGGTFYGSWQRADNQRYTNGNGGCSDGKFVENSIAGFIVDGYKINGDPNNGYVVSVK